MNQDEKRLYLIEYLMREETRIKNLQVPKDVQGTERFTAFTYECANAKACG